MHPDYPPDLVERLRSADPDAFELVYSTEKAALYGFLLRLSRDRHVAADLFQNVWLKLAKHGASLRPDSHVRGWLYTVARHEYVSFRRAQALDLSRLMVIDRSAEGAGAQEASAELRALEAACARLGDADREVLLLAHVEELEPARIAEILGISAVALRQRLARARRRLAQVLDRDAASAPTEPLSKGAR